MGMKREAVQEERQRNKPDNEVESSISPSSLQHMQPPPVPPTSALHLPAPHQPFNSHHSLNAHSQQQQHHHHHNQQQPNSTPMYSPPPSTPMSNVHLHDLTIDRIWEAEQRINTQFQMGGSIATQEIELLFKWIKMIPYFSVMQIEDRVQLLKSGWNELLISELAYRSTNRKDALVLANGTIMERERIIDTSINYIFERVLHELVVKMREIQMDLYELGCVRAIVLLNPGRCNFSRFP